MVRQVFFLILALLLGGEKSTCEHALCQKDILKRNSPVIHWDWSESFPILTFYSQIIDKAALMSLSGFTKREVIVDASGDCDNNRLSRCYRFVQRLAWNHVRGCEGFLPTREYRASLRIYCRQWGVQFLADCLLGQEVGGDRNIKIRFRIDACSHSWGCSDVFAYKNKGELQSLLINSNSCGRHSDLKCDPWAVRRNEIITGNSKLVLNISGLAVRPCGQAPSLCPQSNRRGCEKYSEERDWIGRAKIADPESPIVDDAADQRLGTLFYLAFGCGALFGAFHAFKQHSDALGWLLSVVAAFLIYGAIIGDGTWKPGQAIDSPHINRSENPPSLATSI